jgi:hypothetical protein
LQALHATERDFRRHFCAGSFWNWRLMKRICGVNQAAQATKASTTHEVGSWVKAITHAAMKNGIRSSARMNRRRVDFQPGVLSLASDGRVLYRWRGRPTRKNMGGATERPTAEHVFNRVSSALAAASSSSW